MHSIQAHFGSFHNTVLFPYSLFLFDLLGQTRISTICIAAAAAIARSECVFWLNTNMKICTSQVIQYEDVPDAQ